MQKMMRIINGRSTLVFLDLEGTQESHEMIAFGAIKVDIKKDGSVKRLHKGIKFFVKPKHRIGRYVTKLTGITPELIEQKGISYMAALEELKRYIGKKVDKTVFVTFGSHDIRIFNQSLLHSPDADGAFVKIINRNNLDYSDILSEFVRDGKGNPLSLANYLKVFNVPFEGEAHDPYYDALNLAKLYSAVLAQPEVVYREYLLVLANLRQIPEPVRATIKRLIDGNDVTSAEFGEILRSYIANMEAK